MKYKVDHPLDLPADVKEWWDVRVSWESSKRHFFSSFEEAREYSANRLDKLLKHPTAGPKVNDKKPTDLLVEWSDVKGNTYNLGNTKCCDVLVGSVCSRDRASTVSGHFNCVVAHYYKS